MFAVHELGFSATRVDVAICANVMDFCVRRQPTTTSPIQHRFLFRGGPLFSGGERVKADHYF